jgi:3-hydroxyacyl-CoA dehydrogenase
MLLRMESASKARGPHPKSQAAFNLIATSRVSASSREAHELGLLGGADGTVMDRDDLAASARRAVLDMSEGYSPPEYRSDILLGGRGSELALVETALYYRSRGLATEHDVTVARRLARVLAGGDRQTVHATDEQHVLDLEREAFLSLAGEPKTQARIAHMLETGRPLRN